MVISAGDGWLRLRIRRRTAVVSAALVVALVTALVVAIGSGEYTISPPQVIASLIGQGEGANTFIVQTLRLPRALCAALVGAALGASGAMFQSLTRNPLGSPDIVGFTWGSATGAVLQIIVFDGGMVAVALGAIVGGLITATAVYGLAYSRGLLGYRLILVGIGVSALLASLNTYLIARAPLDTAQAARVWLTGSLNGRGFEFVWPLAVAMVILLPIAVALAPRLRAMEMGDDSARALGLNLERSRLVLIVVAVALCAVATATCGPIAFVALAAPQIALRLTRSGVLGLGASALCGAVLLLSGDILAQRIWPDALLPVGVVTGALGGLYLMWLLWHEWKRGG